MNVDLTDRQSVPADVAGLRSLAELVLEREGYASSCEVSISLVSDETIAEYNERYLGRSGPTDVLAFPIETLTPGAVPASANGGPPLDLGDVLVAPAYVSARAESQGVPVGDELALMVVHGILHLLGYDHQIDREAEIMERRERELLGEVGVDRR